MITVKEFLKHNHPVHLVNIYVMEAIAGCYWDEDSHRYIEPASHSGSDNLDGTYSGWCSKREGDRFVEYNCVVTLPEMINYFISIGACVPD